MAIPIAAAGAAVIGGVRVTTWLVKRHRAKSKTIVLVGPPASRKTTLARVLAEDLSGASGPTVVGKTYEGRDPRSDRRIRAYDMPGADGLAAWKATIDSAKPDLVCVVLDLNKILSSWEHLAAADLCVRHIKGMVKWRQTIALVLTHTDQQAAAGVTSEQAAANPRVKPLLETLSTKNVVAGNLVDERRSGEVLDVIWQWLD